MPQSRRVLVFAVGVCGVTLAAVLSCSGDRQTGPGSDDQIANLLLPSFSATTPALNGGPYTFELDETPSTDL
jgi:hypothetical protein